LALAGVLEAADAATGSQRPARTRAIACAAGRVCETKHIPRPQPALEWRGPQRGAAKIP
jgi:hypothetical protein